MYYSMWHFIANCFTQFIMQPKWCILNSRCHLTSVLASEKRWKFAFFCSHFLALLFLLFWVTLITGHFRLVLDTNALFDVTNMLSSSRTAIFYDWIMKYASYLAIYLNFTSQNISTITHFKIMKYCIRMPEEIHKKVTK